MFKLTVSNVNIPNYTQFPNWEDGIVCNDFDYKHSGITFVQ